MSADATQVTGSPLAGPGAPRPGAVLAERYELLEAIDSDGPAISFRALDQESERQVLVRILASPGVHTDVCDSIVERLRGLVGVGGRFLSSLLDADREGRCPFTVEAWPRGTPLSAILDSRRSRGEALGAREALPVIAQLSAALAALPEGLHHGDVRAERVWLDTDGLRLTGPFLLSALPEDELAERVGKLGPGAVAYAPEAKLGMTGPASDVWGVGSIAWEALTGRSPDPSAHAPEVTGDLRDALVALLAEAPERRPPDLEPILAAVAHHAELSIPHLDPEPHQPPTALVSDMPAAGTEPSASAPMVHVAPPSQDSLDPRLVRAALGVSMDSDAEENVPSADDTARHASISEDVGSLDSLDPRLVRAALDVADAVSSEEVEIPSSTPSVDGLDPRLVRAALGVELDSAESIEMELVEEELESAPPPALKLPPPPGKKPLPPPPSKRPFPAPPRRPGAVGGQARKGLPAPKPRPRAEAPAPRPMPPARPIPPPKPGSMPPPKPRPRAKAPAPKPRPRAEAPAPKPLPAAEAPAPKPRPAPEAPAPEPRPRAEAPTPQPAPRPEPQQPQATPQPVAAAPVTEPEIAAPTPRPAPRSSPPGAHMGGFDVAEEGTAVVGPHHRRVAAAPKKKKRATGVIIVVMALLVAVAIVGVGFIIAGQRRADAARERQLDERLEQLRQSQTLE